MASADLETETSRVVQDLLSTSPAALAGARDLLRAERRRALAEVLPRAEDAYRLLAGSEDLARAVREFGTRRSGVSKREIGED